MRDKYLLSCNLSLLPLSCLDKKNFETLHGPPNAIIMVKKPVMLHCKILYLMSDHSTISVCQNATLKKS